MRKELTGLVASWECVIEGALTVCNGSWFPQNTKLVIERLLIVSSEVLELCRKLREACKTNSSYIKSKSGLTVPSCDKHILFFVNISLCF